MEVQAHFAIHNPSQTFHQARRFIFRFASFDDLFELCSWRDGKGALVDGLISRIKFRDDEVTGRSEGEHPRIIGIVIGAETWKSWK